MNETQSAPNLEAKTLVVSPGAYNPLPTQWQSLTLKDTLGATFLGILTVILLIGWMYAEARYRALMTRLEDTNGNR